MKVWLPVDLYLNFPSAYLCDPLRLCGLYVLRPVSTAEAQRIAKIRRESHQNSHFYVGRKKY